MEKKNLDTKLHCVSLKKSNPSFKFNTFTVWLALYIQDTVTRLATVAFASMDSEVMLSQVSAHNLKTLNSDWMDTKKNASFMLD